MTQFNPATPVIATATFTLAGAPGRVKAGSIVWSHRDDENWILDPTVGIIVMAPARQHIRLFA